MDYNNIYGRAIPFQGELYVGQNIGDDILGDMRVAEEDIRIISPYISQGIFEQIRHQKGKVKLITNTKQIDKELIKEYIVSIDENIIRYKRYEAKIKRIKTVGVIISVILLFGIYLDAYLCFVAMGTFILTFVIADILVKKRNKIQEYKYEYRKSLNFVYADAGEKDIHSKIYIIDNRVAYVCSGNFTNNGMITNFETRICIRDRNAINGLNGVFNRHYNYLVDKQDSKQWEVIKNNYSGKKKFNDAVYVTKF